MWHRAVCAWSVCAERMSYICVAEEEGGEPIELPTEEDGTGGSDGAFGQQNSCSKSCWALRGVK